MLLARACARVWCALSLGLGLGCGNKQVETEPTPVPPTRAAGQEMAGEPRPAPPRAAAEAARAPSFASAALDGCRAMSVTGQVSRGAGTAIRAGDLLTDSGWIELGGASKLVLKHTASAREWTIVGPARSVACAGGREEIIMAQGTLRTEMGIGARPGAEVWVGTPYGSVRYSDARAELAVTEQELTLTALGGELWLMQPTADVSRERRVTGSTAFRAGKAQRLLATAAVAQCARDATDSRAQAEGLLSASAPALGERARAHVRARQRAHATCASAAAAVLQQERGSALEARLRELDAHAEAWRGVPGSKS